MVRDTLLESLQQDSNPGVRVEAVNLLVRSLDASEPDSAPPPARGNLDAPEHAMTAPRAPGLPPDESLANVIRAWKTCSVKTPAGMCGCAVRRHLREINERSER